MMNSSRKRFMEFLDKSDKFPKSAKRDMPEYAYGGRVDDDFEEPEYNIDMIHGHATDFDSSGEPNTEYDYEGEHPMEYENEDMIPRRISKGGMVKRSGLAKALRRGY